MPRPAVEKLSPTANDQWWRGRIQKEEQGLAGGHVMSKDQKSSGVGHEQVQGRAKPDHLVGAGAMVKPATPADPPPEPSPAPAAGTPRTPTEAGAQRQPSRQAPTAPMSEAGGSSASYPRTPALSHVSGSTTDSQIVTRLAKLEQELMKEKVRRERAESEMLQLMKLTAMK